MYEPAHPVCMPPGSIAVTLIHRPRSTREADATGPTEVSGTKSPLGEH